MKFLRKVHSYLYLLSLSLFFFLLWPAFYYGSRQPSRYSFMCRFRRYWGFASSALVGIFYRFEYEQTIDWSKTYIVCCNHSSNLDITAMSLLVKSSCSFMGKEELKDGLATGVFFRSVDIPVNRDSKVSSFRAFKKASERLEQNTTMIIFPEGKIADDYPPVLHPFKNGPFRLAIEHKIPIIPVSSANAWTICWDNGSKYGTKPGICKFKVHAPVETAEMTIEDADGLRDRVYELINTDLVNV